MLSNYIKIAIRTLIRNRGTSLINIIGLAIGLASCILIFLYVRFELSYDQFHKESDNIFRVLTIDEALGVSSNLVGITMPALSETMKNEFPQVENSVRINNGGRTLLRYEDQTFYSEDMKYVEPTFLEIFDYEWVDGVQEQALIRPSTGVLTESMAEKIFGKEEAIGKTVRLEDGSDIEVTGIMADPPANSHLKFDLLISFVPAEGDSSTVQYLQSWNSISMISYVQVTNPAEEVFIEEKMEEMIRQHDVGENFSVTLQPLKDVHLKSSGVLYDGYNEDKTDRGYVITLMVVALFIILIASFNFMNLSTARSSNRAREVGMRKVLGAFRQQLILQFLGESVLLCIISLILAIGLIALVDDLVPLPLDEHLLVYLFRDKGLLFTMLGGTIALGLLAGSYPALLLSSFKPVTVLKGKFLSSSSGIWLRRSLVVVQFTASIGMIIGTMIVSKQLDLIKSQDKGFNPEQIVTITLGNREVRNNFENIKNEWSQLPAIKSIASSNSMPGNSFGRRGIRPEGVGEDDVWIVSVMGMNEEYVPLLGMEIVEGRNFSQDFSTDSTNAVLINETMAKQLGWENSAIGRNIQTGPYRNQVVGVVKDFHFANMRHKIEPIMMYYQADAQRNLVVKLETQDLSNTLALMEEGWGKVNPQFPFEYTFFDQDFAQQYQSEETFSQLVQVFTWLAIFIACLGLLGLSAFNAEQRTKEIGIRKILGASVNQIVVLLSKEFTILVVLSSVIAAPLAGFLMESWLQDFAYRIHLSWVDFALAGLIALAIALITNAYHAIKTAISNPTEALRWE